MKNNWIGSTIQGGIIFLLPFLILYALVLIVLHFFKACYVVYKIIKGRPRSPKSDKEAYMMKYRTGKYFFSE